MTGKALTPGDICWSALVEEEGRLVRQDFSAEGWTEPPPNAVGYWRCVVPPEQESGERRLDTSSLFEYFLQLCESPNVVEQQHLYVLALLLLRKKRLILEETVETEGQSSMRLIGSGGEGPFTVTEVELAGDSILEIQSQLFGTADAA
ncbi:MAG: hypothetical protein R3C19_15095 [Planctomycetaceae bacterium]